MNKNIIDTIYEKMPHMSQTDKKISEVGRGGVAS